MTFMTSSRLKGAEIKVKSIEEAHYNHQTAKEWAILVCIFLTDPLGRLGIYTR